MRVFQRAESLAETPQQQQRVWPLKKKEIPRSMMSVVEEVLVHC
jgi:hypothetical protein